jgi:hypothetical protein
MLIAGILGLCMGATLTLPKDAVKLFLFLILEFVACIMVLPVMADGVGNIIAALVVLIVVIILDYVFDIALF